MDCYKCQYARIFDDGWCKCSHPYIKGNHILMKYGCIVEKYKEWGQGEPENPELMPFKKIFNVAIMGVDLAKEE